MAGSEPPITIEELVELNALERESRGLSADDVIRSTRARLTALRARKESGELNSGPPVTPIEARVAVLEDEVKRLRELIERKNG